MIKLLVFSLLILSINCADLQSIFNSIHPQSPQLPPQSQLQSQSQVTPQFQVPQHPHNHSISKRISDGGEINPNFNGNNWNRKSPLITDFPPYRPVHKSDTEWFPSLNENDRNNNSGGSDGSREYTNYNHHDHYNTHHRYNHNTYDHRSTNDHYYYNHNNYHDNSDPEFEEKLALINPKNYETTSSILNRDTKLLSLSYEILSTSSPTNKPLNILHLGTGSGFVPMALAVFSRPNYSILSLDDTANYARDNIIRDGKSFFLRRLSLQQVPNLSTALIPRPPNNLPYDLIISSKSISQSNSFPRSLKDSLVPRGIIIYPEEAGRHRRLKMDRLNEYGHLTNLKTIEL